MQLTEEIILLLISLDGGLRDFDLFLLVLTLPGNMDGGCAILYNFQQLH